MPFSSDEALRWHWENDRRVCNSCGSEVWVFKEGEICSGCEKGNNGNEEK